MTKEQIKNLKAGDKFTIEYEVRQKLNNGYFLIHYSNGDYCSAPASVWEGFKHATFITPPPPVFEVGDTVRIVPDPMTGTVYGNGNSYAEWAEQDARILKEKLRATEMQVALSSGHIIVVNIHCLELVKKATKDKYSVRICKGGAGWVSYKVVTLENEETVASFSYHLHPNAKAAAEAECARLNAEWRKQQEGSAE